MSIFQYNNKYKTLTANINGIMFCCENVKIHYESLAKELSVAYKTKVSKLINYLYDELNPIYDNISDSNIIQKLGTPIIDLDKKSIIYFEHTLDNQHIISVEFGGIIDKFYNIVIDG